MAIYTVIHLFEMVVFHSNARWGYAQTAAVDDLHQVAGAEWNYTMVFRGGWRTHIAG